MLTALDGEALARVYGQGLALSAALGQAGQFLWTPVGVATLSGSPAPGLNATLVWRGAEPLDLERIVAFVHDRGLTGNHMMSAAAHEALAPHALRMGLVPVGAMPLMTLAAERAPLGHGAWEGAVERLGEWERVRDEAAPLVAEAFALPLEAMRLVVSPLAVADVGLDVFVARLDGIAMSTVYTTCHGGAVGIWNMATPPRFQRRGAGRAALEAALAHHRRRGARWFYLSATPAGMSLYRRLGFQVVTALMSWSLASALAPGSG